MSFPRRLRASDPLAAGLAATVALAAAVPQRLGAILAAAHPWALLAAATVLAIAAGRAQGALRPSDLPIRNASATLLIAWVCWSFSGVVASPVPGTTLATVAVFVTVGFGAAVLVARAGLGAMGPVLVAALALGLVIGTAAGSVGGIGDLQFAFLEPNQLARASALVAVITAAAAADRDRRGATWFVVAAVVAALIVAATGSRTGLGALAVGLATLGLARSPRFRWGVPVLIFIVMVGAGALLVSGADIDDADQTGEAEALTSLSGRTSIWPEVLDRALEDPATGVGLGADTTVLSRFQPDGRAAWRIEHAHSLPLHVLLTTGVPGALLALAALLAVYAEAWSRGPDETSAAVLALLSVIVVDGIAESVLRAPAFAWLALAGSSAALGRVRRDAQVSDVNSRSTSSSISSTARS